MCTENLTGNQLSLLHIAKQKINEGKLKRKLLSIRNLNK